MCSVVVDLGPEVMREAYMLRMLFPMVVIRGSRGLYVGSEAQMIAVPSWTDVHREALVKETVIGLSVGFAM